MFSQEDINFISEGFDKLSSLNKYFVDNGCRRIVYPDKLTEILAGYLYECLTGYDIVRKSSDDKGDLYNRTLQEHIEVKSTVMANKNDCSSFGAQEVFDRILFLEINEIEKTATLYDIPISNIDIMNVEITNRGETFAESCLNGIKKRRPHFSIKKKIIERYNIMPSVKAIFEEGQWRI